MITIRCSSLPRIMSCPASLEVGEIQIQSSSDNASIGTAVHEVMADIIRAGDFKMPDLYPYAARNGVEVEDIRFLCWRGLNVWKQYEPIMCNVKAELEHNSIFHNFHLVGHSDVSGSNEETGMVWIIDWKTGTDRDQIAQLKGYALLCENPEGVKVIVANLRENVVDVLDFTSKQLTDFADEIEDIVLTKNKPYNPTSDNCHYCPRRLDCPAKSRLTINSVNALGVIGEHSITREDIASLYEKRKIVGKLCEQYDAALKMTLKDGGDIILHDGRVLTMEECERETIKFDGYFTEIASKELSDEKNIFEAIRKIGSENITVKKQALIKAVRAAAPKGERDEAEERFMKELRAAWCVDTTKFDKIVCRKA